MISPSSANPSGRRKAGGRGELAARDRHLLEQYRRTYDAMNRVNVELAMQAIKMTLSCMQAKEEAYRLN